MCGFGLYFCMRQTSVTLSPEKDLEATTYHRRLRVLKLWAVVQVYSAGKWSLREVALMWHWRALLYSLCSVAHSFSQHQPISEPGSFPLYLLASLRHDLQHLCRLWLCQLFFGTERSLYGFLFQSHCNLTVSSKIFLKIHSEKLKL